MRLNEINERRERLIGAVGEASLDRRYDDANLARPLCPRFSLCSNGSWRRSKTVG